MAAFPYAAPLPRPEEPPRPEFTYEGGLPNPEKWPFEGNVPYSFVWMPILWTQTNPEWQKTVQPYYNWMVKQPDRELLVLDFEQRWDWFIARGETLNDVLYDQITSWSQKRWDLAEEIRSTGHSHTLDTYWPNNPELRQLQPPIEPEWPSWL